jgi:hypothetical protein
VDVADRDRQACDPFARAERLESGLFPAPEDESLIGCRATAERHQLAGLPRQAVLWRKPEFSKRVADDLVRRNPCHISQIKGQRFIQVFDSTFRRDDADAVVNIVEQLRQATVAFA